MLRYWDGRQWTNQTRTDNPWPPEPQPKPSKVMSVVAFVLAGAAMLIPFLGVAGIGFGIAAAVRKEKLGQRALWVAAGATVVGFVIWGAINSR